MLCTQHNIRFPCLPSGERPNTYTYTKAIAEHLIAEEAAKEEDPSLRIPMAIGEFIFAQNINL